MSARHWRVRLIGEPPRREWVAVVQHVTGGEEIRVRVKERWQRCDACGTDDCEHLQAAVRIHRRTIQGKEPRNADQ